MASDKARAAAIEAALAEGIRSHAGVPRLAAPNADLTSDELGPRVELHADEHGIVRPADPDQVRLADALGLAVLRSPDQEAPVSEVAVEPGPAIGRMNKSQLLELAAERGVVIEEGATNDDIRAALTAAAEQEG